MTEQRMRARNPRDSNQIETNGFSNPATEAEFKKGSAALRSRRGDCWGCSFYAPLHDHVGLCCCRKSRHYLETVFELFVCKDLVAENWGSHSFWDNPTAHFYQPDLVNHFIALYQMLARSEELLGREDRQEVKAARTYLLALKKAWEESPSPLKDRFLFDQVS